jgi:hypothetical protein
LAAALRHALREGRGRVVLRVEEHAAHRRKVARALLQEGALAAGGQVMDGPAGDLLLVGAEARRAERLRELVERLVGPATTLTWSLERDAAALLAYAEGATAAPAPMAPGPALEALDAFIAAADLPPLLRRRLVEPAAGGAPALRLEPAPEAIAAALGALGTDPSLVAHAARLVAARLLQSLADPAAAAGLVGTHRPRRLHLPLAGLTDSAMGRAAAGRLVATLPLALAAEPAALAARLRQLDEAGIVAELDGLDADSLGILDPGALPPVLLRLHATPALGEFAARAALAGIDPARLVLAGDGAGLAAALGAGWIERPA